MPDRDTKIAAGTTPPYDFSGRLADLCQAFDSERPAIAGEILGQIARIAEARDRFKADARALERELQTEVRQAKLAKATESMTRLRLLLQFMGSRR